MFDLEERASVVIEVRHPKRLQHSTGFALEGTAYWWQSPPEDKARAIPARRLGHLLSQTCDFCGLDADRRRRARTTSRTSTMGERVDERGGEIVAAP